MLDVQLTGSTSPRTTWAFPQDDLGEEYTGWAAEWGLRDDPVGIEDSNEDLQQLIDDILDDARQWTDRYDLAIEWDLSGDAPAVKTVQDIVAEAGVSLPTAVARQTDSSLTIRDTSPTSTLPGTDTIRKAEGVKRVVTRERRCFQPPAQPHAPTHAFEDCAPPSTPVCQRP